MNSFAVCTVFLAQLLRQSTDKVVKYTKKCSCHGKMLMPARLASPPHSARARNRHMLRRLHGPTPGAHVKLSFVIHSLAAQEGSTANITTMDNTWQVVTMERAVARSAGWPANSACTRIIRRRGHCRRRAHCLRSLKSGQAWSIATNVIRTRRGRIREAQRGCRQPQ